MIYEEKAIISRGWKYSQLKWGLNYGDKRKGKNNLRDITEEEEKREQQEKQLEADINAVTNTSYARVYKNQYRQYYSMGHKK